MICATYPRTTDDHFFAVHFCKFLATCNAAQQIGSGACWLLTVIAFQEDNIRYARPVDFWNHQLMVVCGFSSEGSLLRARAKAVDSGWLHYVRGRKSTAAVYWCTIPNDLQGQFESRFTTKIHTQSGGESDRKTDLDGTCTSKIDVKTQGKRLENDQHPSPVLNPPRTKKNKGTSKLVPPTVDEVRRYCEELLSNVVL